MQPQPLAPGTQFPSGAGAYTAAPPARKKSKAPIIVIAVILVVALAAAALWFFWLRDNLPGSSSGNTDNPTPAQTADGTGDKTATRLVLAGSCFELAQTEASSPAYGYVWVVPCTQPHDSEVFLNQAITDSTYPDDAGWDDLAGQYCDPAFKSYVGSDMDSSRLDVQYIRPTSQSWDAGNKQLVCFTVDPDGNRTTSVAGTGE